MPQREMTRNYRLGCPVVTVLLIGVAEASFGAGDADDGRIRAEQCAPCHGLDGIGTQPMYPNLAGQKYEYIMKQLWSFKRGGRKDPSMLMQVRQLEGQDVADLAAYFSGLGCGSE